MRAIMQDGVSGFEDQEWGTRLRDFADKTAFVTGGASGIGLALGRAFAEADMKVMLADVGGERA